MADTTLRMTSADNGRTFIDFVSSNDRLSRVVMHLEKSYNVRVTNGADVLVDQDFVAGDYSFNVPAGKRFNILLESSLSIALTLRR